MAGEGNGEKFDRALRAAAAYAELKRDIAKQNALLFKDPDTGRDGYLPRIERGVSGLYQNPLVKLGFWMDTKPKQLAGGLGFLATLAVVMGGVHQVGAWAGWWR